MVMRLGLGLMSFLRSIWNWLRRQVVDDVPPGDGLCEFDCRKPQCTEGEWEVCERRLRGAEGELMPEQKPDAQASEFPKPAKDDAGGVAIKK